MADRQRARGHSRFPARDGCECKFKEAHVQKKNLCKTVGGGAHFGHKRVRLSLEGIGTLVIITIELSNVWKRLKYLSTRLEEKNSWLPQSKQQPRTMNYRYASGALCVPIQALSIGTCTSRVSEERWRSRFGQQGKGSGSRCRPDDVRNGLQTSSRTSKRG
jgi:hypothetical protein